MKKITFLIFAFLICIIVGSLWFLEKKAPMTRGGFSNTKKDFEVLEGDGSTEVGRKLEEDGLIKSKYLFYYYVWRTGTDNKIQAGKYELSSNLALSQIVEILIKGKIKKELIKLTVPEGYTNKKIIELLKKIKPEIAGEFEKIVSCKCIGEISCECDIFSQEYDFIKDIPKGVDLEGYLFPDTYFIYEEDTGRTLVDKFLNNFQRKVSGNILEEINNQKKSLHDVITMASIVEKEVNKDPDRAIVAGIFWKRIQEGTPIQSCATLAYATGKNKEKYYEDDINFPSPYNTYLNQGLPPGPISNPGLDSIKAAVWPKESEYYFFLSDPKTGETIFSRNSQEHSENKAKSGL